MRLVLWTRALQVPCTSHRVSTTPEDTNPRASSLQMLNLPAPRPWTFQNHQKWLMLLISPGPRHPSCWNLVTAETDFSVPSATPAFPSPPKPGSNISKSVAPEGSSSPSRPSTLTLKPEQVTGLKVFRSQAKQNGDVSWLLLRAEGRPCL